MTARTAREIAREISETHGCDDEFCPTGCALLEAEIAAAIEQARRDAQREELESAEAIIVNLYAEPLALEGLVQFEHWLSDRLRALADRSSDNTKEKK